MKVFVQIFLGLSGYFGTWKDVKKSSFVLFQELKVVVVKYEILTFLILKSLLRNIVNKEQITAILGLHNGTVSFTHIEIEATCVQNSRIDYLL